MALMCKNIHTCHIQEIHTCLWISSNLRCACSLMRCSFSSASAFNLASSADLLMRASSKSSFRILACVTITNQHTMEHEP